jgi:hypothetical protein
MRYRSSWPTRSPTSRTSRRAHPGIGRCSAASSTWTGPKRWSTTARVSIARSRTPFVEPWLVHARRSHKPSLLLRFGHRRNAGPASLGTTAGHGTNYADAEEGAQIVRVVQWRWWLTASKISGGMAERTGLEPATPGVTGRYSNQLNYRSVRNPSRSCIDTTRGRRQEPGDRWWVLQGSNLRPTACKAVALPAELNTPGGGVSYPRASESQRKRRRAAAICGLPWLDSGWWARLDSNQ